MNIIRLYNQNRRKIWKAIIIIASIIILIQLLNYWAGSKNNSSNLNTNMDNINNTGLNSFETNASYVNTNAVISGGSLSSETSKKDIKVISDFIDFCNFGDINSAYELLSDECKQVCYQNVSDLKNGYCNTIFNQKKLYNIEAWDTGSVNMYKITFTEDILATGKADSLHTEDYYNLVEDNDGNKKLNINGFIERKKTNVKKTYNNVIFNIKYVNIYKEYSEYGVSVENKSKDDVILDSREKTNNIYITDKKNVNSYALIHELIDNDLIVKSGRTNNFTIRFNNTFRSSRSFVNFTFADCNISGEKEVVIIEF